jgi:DNA invertase Pin-like site-specific DNA recombinase
LYSNTKTMNKVKYIRCSTAEQNTGSQETNSNNFSKVYIDKCSGVINLSERPEGKKLLKDIEGGNINEVHITSIDRLGRSIIDILVMVKFFNERKINLHIENIGMDSLINGEPNTCLNMMVAVLGNVASMERELLLARQRRGIELAKSNGTYTGRLYGTKISDDQLLKKYKTVAKELKSGQSLRRAAALGNCSLGTAQKVQKLLLKAA